MAIGVAVSSRRRCWRGIGHSGGGDRRRGHGRGGGGEVLGGVCSSPYHICGELEGADDGFWLSYNPPVWPAFNFKAARRWILS